MLSDVLEGLQGYELHGDPATNVTSIEFDSRRVRTGSVFCCVPGQVADGHEYVGEAVRNGASAIVCERPMEVAAAQVEVKAGEIRPVMAKLASRFYGDPSRSLAVVGVTGTNGKTTVTHMIRALMESSGRRAEVLGTLNGPRTTPESPDLQRWLAEVRDAGVEVVAMEVSSHALVQHRVDAVEFRVGAFTNLGHDHLDFHGSMEAYFDAKAALFDGGRCATAVINIDDPWGARVAGRLASSNPSTEVVTVQPVAAILGRRGKGMAFTWRNREVYVPLPGRFNVENALVAAEVARTLGLNVDEIVDSMARLPAVPGRMESVGGTMPVTVLVDYAHTPDGLAEALRSLVPVSDGHRLVCVFGCGGDRDTGKRAPMGEVAGALADVVVVTSDNPRSEDPASIIDDILAGLSASDAEVVVEPDRAAAIGKALAMSEPGDVILVAGKGHERTQDLGSQVVPFDDREVARQALAGRFGHPGEVSAP